jgi:hypothetical protein
MCPHLTPVILRAFSARADNPTGSDDENEHVADIQAFKLEAAIAAENFEQPAKWFIPMRLRQKVWWQQQDIFGTSWNRLRPSGRPARSRRIRQDRKFGCSDPTDVRAAKIQTAGLGAAPGGRRSFAFCALCSSCYRYSSFSSASCGRFDK